MSESAEEFTKRLIGAWDCCGTCAGGVLAERDRRIKAEAQAVHRDLTRRLGFGDDITEPMADNNTIVAWFDQQGRDAAEWREHERFRDECLIAGHDPLNDCDEHGPGCCQRPHLTEEAAVAASESEGVGI